MLPSFLQSVVDKQISPEMKIKIRKFHLWKKKHVGIVVGIALLLLLAVGAGASMILVRTSSDLRQQAMVESGGGNDPYAPTKCYYIDTWISDPNDMECRLDPNSKSSGCEETGWSNLSLEACQKKLDDLRNPKTNYSSLCYTLKSPSYPSDGCYQLNVVASYPNQPCEQITIGSQKFYTYKADCERITTPAPGQGGAVACANVGSECDGKNQGDSCYSRSSGIPGSCIDMNTDDSSNSCTCYARGNNNMTCFGGQSYCFNSVEYVCNADSKGVTKVKSCGILGCDESTGKCKVVPTATPMQITCFWRYPSNAQYCSKTTRTVSYSTQTCEQIGSYLYTNEGDCNGKYGAIPTLTPTVTPIRIVCYQAFQNVECIPNTFIASSPNQTCEELGGNKFTKKIDCDNFQHNSLTSTPRVPTSTPILFVTNTPAPTSAPIVFVTNTPAPKVTLPVPTPTIVIQEPVQIIPVCRTTSGLLSRFSWWRNICTR